MHIKIKEKKQEKTLTLASNDSGEKVVVIKFHYDLDLLYKIRELPGRKYHPEEKCWSAPVYSETIERLTALGFTVDEKLTQFLKEREHKKTSIEKIEIDGLHGTLRPFQSKGVAFIDSRNGRAIIGDEMGTGKTIQSLAWLQLHPEKRVAIVICPSIAKLHWARKAEEWLTNPNVEILSGKKPWSPSGDILIINYDILSKWVDTLLKLRPQVLIADECHHFKNNKAKRTKAVKQLGRFIPNIITLSGTLIENRTIEIYNAWQLVDPIGCPRYWDFVQRYCNAKHTRFGWDVSGHSNTLELHRRLTDTVMIRRLKSDVLTELPDKEYSFVPIELNNEEEYRFAEEDFIAFIKRFKGDIAAIRASKAKALAQTEALKQVAVKGKLNNIIEWIEDFLESDQKLVVFAHHKSVIQSLMDRFERIAVKIDGSTKDIDKQKAEDQFQTNPKIRLFVGNMKAAGQVITLTAASNIAIIELPWTPGALNQSIDRVHRMGQDKGVTVHFLLAANTIEEKIAKLLDVKSKIIKSVLDGQDIEDVDLLTELFKQYDKN